MICYILQGILAVYNWVISQSVPGVSFYEHFNGKFLFCALQTLVMLHLHSEVIILTAHVHLQCDIVNATCVE